MEKIFPELIKKLNTIINESIIKLPINIVSEAQNNIKCLIKKVGSLSLILIGDSNVGKRSFFNCYFKRESIAPALGIDKEIKYIKIGNEEYKIAICNTVGQERLRSLSKKYYQNDDGVLFFFDITNE